MDTRECIICQKKFKPRRHNQTTCRQSECVRELKRDWERRYRQTPEGKAKTRERNLRWWKTPAGQSWIREQNKKPNANAIKRECARRHPEWRARHNERIREKRAENSAAWRGERQCAACRREFQPHRPKQVICGSAACYRHHGKPPKPPEILAEERARSARHRERAKRIRRWAIDAIQAEFLLMKGPPQ